MLRGAITSLGRSVDLSCFSDSACSFIDAGNSFVLVCWLFWTDCSLIFEAALAEVLEEPVTNGKIFDYLINFLILFKCVNLYYVNILRSWFWLEFTSICVFFNNKRNIVDREKCESIIKVWWQSDLERSLAPEPEWPSRGIKYLLGIFLRLNLISRFFNEERK